MSAWLESLAREANTMLHFPRDFQAAGRKGKLEGVLSVECDWFRSLVYYFHVTSVLQDGY